MCNDISNSTQLISYKRGPFLSDVEMGSCFSYYLLYVAISSVSYHQHFFCYIHYNFHTHVLWFCSTTKPLFCNIHSLCFLSRYPSVILCYNLSKFNSTSRGYLQLMQLVPDHQQITVYSRNSFCQF